MASKPLFGDLIASHKDLAEELKTVDVAADLTLLLQHAGVSREVLASKLGWSGDRLSQVLSGHENITVQTIAAVAGALGYACPRACFMRKASRPMCCSLTKSPRLKNLGHKSCGFTTCAPTSISPSKPTPCAALTWTSLWTCTK